MTQSKLIVTTSWDDGFPADSKLASLLAKYGIAGTFYIPNRNSEGRDVMSEAEVRRLSAQFEIGGHSIDHVVLAGVDDAEATKQVTHNKRWLEDLTGAPVPGFCYVRGRHTARLKAVVRRAGFEYARTVAGLYTSGTGDPFAMPTTMQLYPHRKSVYFKNFLRGRPDRARSRLLWAALSSTTLEERIDRVIDLCRQNGGTFHLWGHSWEIEELDLWGTLETVLRRLAAQSESIVFATNHGVHRRAMQRHGEIGDVVHA
jgi:peptidoglycan/xylan/chitin deacetylase (PgdA/CDA1 family)